MKQLNEFDTLEKARTYPHNQERMVSNSMMFALLGEHESMVSLEASVDNKARAFLAALNSNVKEYNLMTNSDLGKRHQASLSHLVSIGAVTQAFATAAINHANDNITYPHANKTLVEFNNAKGVYTEKEAIGFARGKNIKVTLIDTLPENCAITTWEKDGDFGYQNFGKHCHANPSQNLYKIKTDNKKPDGQLFVRIPLENFNFAAEVV